MVTILMDLCGSMKLLQFPDRLTQQFQTNVREAIDPLIKNPLANGHLLSNISLLAGITNVVPIGLTQPLAGWFLTRLKSNSIVWDSQDSNLTPSQNLQLLCSADCVVSIFVF